MLLFLDKSLDLEKSYEQLYEALGFRHTLHKYVFSKNPYEVIEALSFAMVNGLEIVLLDGDFSLSEIQNLGISADNLAEEYFIEKPCNVSNNDEFVRWINRNSKLARIGIFTSGTAGRPKRIDHTLESLLRGIRVSENHRNDVWGFAYNITHFAGIQVILQAMMNENPIINIFGKNAQQAEYLLFQYGCTCISATPTYYKSFILNSPGENSMVRNVTFGGEKFSNHLLEKINAKYPNAKIRNEYASTEVGSLISGNGEAFSIPSNLKHLIRISPNNHLLIHKNLVTHMRFNGEWYDTNDTVVLNEDGSFQIQNRDSDFINVGGYKVNPLEVEDVISTVNGVVDVTVYGRKNSVIGSILVADVVVAQNEDEKEIKMRILGRLRNELQDFKIPRLIKFVDAVNKSRTGKKVR